MPEWSVEVLTSLGLPGLVIAALVWWVKKLDERLVTSQARIDALQNQRVEDAQKLAAGVVSLSEALDRQSAKLDAYLEKRIR